MILVAVDPGTGNSMQLNWGNGTGEFDYYEILWSDGENVGTATSDINEYLVEGLVSGQEYQFLVSVVDQEGFKSAYSMTIGTPYELPFPPADLDIVLNSSSITLDWEDNQELDLAGYNIYRSLEANGDFTKINDQLITESISIQSADYQIQYYLVTAVDTDGNESEYSNMVSGRAMTLDQGLLIVDESRDQNGGPTTPTDEEMDIFYNSLFTSFYQNVTHYDLNLTEDISLADLCIYEVIYWHNNKESFDEMIYERTDVIKRYLDAGGKIVLSIQQPSITLAHDDLYPLTFGSGDPIYDIFKIEFFRL